MDGHIQNVKKNEERKEKHAQTYTVDEKERCNKLEMQQKKNCLRNTTEEKKKKKMLRTST